MTDKSEVVEEVKAESEEVKEVKAESEEVVNKSNDIEIPETLEKYRKDIESLVNEYKLLVKNTVDNFDGGDFMLLVNAITKTITQLRKIVDDIKDADADDKVTIFNLLISLVVVKSVEHSDLDETIKSQVIGAFETGGMVLNLIELIRESFKNLLTKMDTNKDNYVSREEFQQYHEDKFNQDCGCFGEEHNKKEAERFTQCCFGLLSGGKKKIKIQK